jgi:hypothetical protein
MDDADLRGELLTVFYNLRHNADGWVPASDMNVKDGAATLQVVGVVCQQLADAGLIEWKALMGDEGLAAGMARITGHGVDVVKGSRSSSIDVRLPNVGAENHDKGAREAVTEEALTAVRTTLATIKPQISAVTLSNTAKAEIDADIKQIEAEVERPNPRHRFMKLYLESLRDNLAKAAGVGTVAALAAVGTLIAKYFGAF